MYRISVVNLLNEKNLASDKKFKIAIRRFRFSDQTPLNCDRGEDTLVIFIVTSMYPFFFCPAFWKKKNSSRINTKQVYR